MVLLLMLPYGILHQFSESLGLRMTTKALLYCALYIVLPNWVKQQHLICLICILSIWISHLVRHQNKPPLKYTHRCFLVFSLSASTDLLVKTNVQSVIYLVLSLHPASSCFHIASQLILDGSDVYSI